MSRIDPTELERMLQRAHQPIPAPLVQEGILTETAMDVETFCDLIGQLGEDLNKVATMLKRVLEYSRVHAISGFKRERCRACDVPHLLYRRCPCPHHEAVVLLHELGMVVDTE